LYWLLLLRKYLKENRDDKKEEIYNFIKSCEVEIHDYDQLGFKSTPDQGKKPDIWSTYYAFSSLSILGMLREYIASKEKDDLVRKINNFINNHKKGHKFLHCLEKNCKICENDSYARNLYFITEILRFLGIDIRLYTKQFQSYLDYVKKDSSIVYKLAISKALDIDSEVKDKEIENLYQFQRSDGGFSYDDTEGTIKTSFWVVYILELYSWKVDYNPAEIYSFVNRKINELLDDKEKWNLLRAEIGEKKENLENYLYAELGEINIDSHMQLKFALNAKGISVPNTKRETLAAYSNHHPVLTQIMEYRKVANLLQSYIIPIPKFVNSSTERIHAEYNQLGADTGRFSCQKPSLQNIPKDVIF